MNGDAEIRFCPATADDIEELVRIRIVSMRQSLERVGRFDPDRARRRLLDGLVLQNTKLIELGGVRVGFLVVKRDRDHLLLDHLYVLPEYQGRGVGTKALAHVLAEADSMGKQVRVGALKLSRANEFYQKCGFEFVETKEWDNYYVYHPRKPSLRSPNEAEHE